MRKKHSYRAVDVEHFDLSTFLPVLTAGCIVSVDVAKTKFFLALATVAGEVLTILRFEHPRQTRVVLELLRQLKTATASVAVLLEPTGTYGDWLQEQSFGLGCEVWMVPSVFTHLEGELLDGVKSKHDAKDAVAMVGLHIKEKSYPWEPPSEERRQTRALVDESNMYMTQLMPLYGRIEAMLARYWPEFEQWIDLSGQKSWISLLTEMPGPEMVSKQAKEAKMLLKKASHNAMSAEKINGLVDGASQSLGVRMTTNERNLLSKLVKQIGQIRELRKEVDAQLSTLAQGIPEAKALGEVVGMPTAAALYTMVGEPSSFANASAYQKAYGLNLKERSSGKHKGELKITKQGPGLARQRIYLAALRLIGSNEAVAAWYRNRENYAPKQKTIAVVAVMRKLVKALWHVAKGNPFTVSKLFDLKKLNLLPESKSEPEAPLPNKAGACKGKQAA